MRTLVLSQVRTLTNESVQLLAHKCPALHTVTMTEVDEVTGDGLQALAASLPLAKLSTTVFGVEPAYAGALRVYPLPQVHVECP